MAVTVGDMTIKQWQVAVIAAVATGGLALWASADGARARREAPFQSVEQRALSAPATRADLPIVARTLNVGGNQVEVIDIPSTVNARLALVETQRCYVWRDLEFRTSSITCPQEGEVAPAIAPPPPSFER